ncbi:sucrase-isomaltase, intestinal [Parasteatoda tepidariorum]|uniref:sucrase-isomaltase, intestinal n=1 Tax=Parasteatoda tepidariorum TaxID=114398 RepID=UPI00077FD750|nr:maltase-glucoamylase, intestinal [Parasteatoda tepidariorum]XP_015930992.1 maltase-glucoamylase, intestinal [Parasteatoda tepidariorum]
MTRTRTPTSAQDSQTNKKKTCCFGKKICTYSCKVWCMVIVCALLLAAAAVLLYFLLTKKPILPERVLALSKITDWRPLCPIELSMPKERFDCYPEDSKVDQENCESRGCCYLGLSNSDSYSNHSDTESAPICVYPKNYGYISSGKVESTFSGFEIPLYRLPSPSRFGDDLQLIHMKVEMQTKYRLRIKFYDPGNYRYEVPQPNIPMHTSSQTSEAEPEVFLYSVTYDTINKPFTVKVRRASTDAVIFDTSVGALTMANQFLELTTRLSTHNLFGLKKRSFKTNREDFNWETVSLFSSKNNPKSGSHPMYLCLEEDGNAHGVLLLTSNILEMQLHPLPAATFRAIGGVLDFYLFLGPTPEDVRQQFTEAIGFSVMPPYWAFGLHTGFSEQHSLNDTEKFVDEFRSKHIPFDSVVLRQEIIDKVAIENFTGKKFQNFTSKLKSKNQKLVLELAAGIPKSSVTNRDSIFNGGLQNDIFITDKWGLNAVEAWYHDAVVVYPDFGSSGGVTWWSQITKKISDIIELDGSSLIDNEPVSNSDGSVNGCLNDNLNRPPYVPRVVNNAVYEKTLCMDALLRWKDDTITHYDYHNFYGHAMVIATDLAFDLNYPAKRKLIVSDSTFVGTGQYAGHYIKDLSATWADLQASISIVLGQGLHGIALSGINVCGAVDSHKDERSNELCLRWLQLGIFYPLLQLYGTGAKYIFNAGVDDREFYHDIRNALSRRYELLPYLYTLFHLSHTKGSSVVRPLFFEFPNDNETFSIDSQFMWGSSLLISPILEEGAEMINFYLPEGIWYDYYQGGPFVSSGEWFSETGGPFLDSKQPAVLHIRAGHILTLQKPSETTTASRLNSMSILVALNSSYEAKGLLYWDDGETKNSHALGEYILVEYSASGNTLVVNGNFGKKVFRSSFYKAAIEQVRIMGLNKFPKRIIIDGSYILSNKQYHWNYDTMVLDLKLILIPLGRRTELQWVF